MDNSVTKKRAQSNEIDMLNGPLFKKILLFALPLAASSLLQELFNSVDVAVVGHFVGSRALAAVGSNAPVIGLLINLFMGVSMGACAIISNHIGQQTGAYAMPSVQCSWWRFSADSFCWCWGRWLPGRF